MCVDLDETLAHWKRNQPTDVKEGEIFRILSEMGFQIKKKGPQSSKRLKGNHGYTAFHEDLRGCPLFMTGRLTISTHSEGRQGQVSTRTLVDICKAAQWIKKVEGERNDNSGN